MSAIMDEARERALELDKVWREAQTKALNAWAELARLDLIRLAEENPLIEGMTFESSFEYDDEGGYYRSVNPYPLTSSGEEGAVYADVDPDWDFHDTFYQYGHEVLCILCGVDEDADSGSITIAEARERSF